MAKLTSPTNARSGLLLPIVFGSTILLSAMLLFSIQPVMGKLLLPLLGGAPSVWNTVMVFFQAMLLAGYAYAHYSFRKLGIQYQPWLQIGLLVVAGLLLPFSVKATVNQELPPALWVLIVLGQTVAVPVFVLASTAPLLQKWFSSTTHRSASDPYFLYAASNVGSFGALFAYPLFMERLIPLSEQSFWWSIAFWTFAACMLVCSLLVRKTTLDIAPPITAPTSSVPRLTKWKWIGLSFVPSSLMLGVTTYITTDVASVPLLWIIPLAIYLFTFVIAFGQHSEKVNTASSRAIPILALALVFPMLVQATEPIWVLVLLHLLFFFFAALQCHLKLARSRPSTDQLTSFYLYLSLGGVLGGIFNALAAPLIFSAILEYPLMILAATIIGFPERSNHKPRFSIPPVYGGSLIVLLMVVGSAAINLATGFGVAAANILAGLFLLASFLFIRKPVRYTLAIATLLVCTSLFRQASNPVLERDRNFFGVLRVAEEANKPLRRIYHGTTIHGVQFTAPERRCEPLSYYHSDGPVADITALFTSVSLPRNVGLIGLGAGAMLSFSKPSEHWTIYEIDPAVVRIASDTNYFTYLSACSAAGYSIVLGDARLRLQAAPDQHFGLLYLDAFSSDVVPMHLLTVEALKLYRQKLAPGGILAFHISSRHFELEPLVAKVGELAGLQCFESTKGELTTKAIEEGGLESVWVILLPEDSTAPVLSQASWRRVYAAPSAPVWTDDFSSLLAVLKR